MARCGNYELDRAIGWGRRSTYFAARMSGAGGAAMLVIRRARTVERTRHHAFMRAAAEQQAAVSAGCRRLAPILAFDCDESGFAYYATTRYETSLAEFLEAGCKVDSPLLREIVTGVLGSLAELHEKSRRAHGNLTPGNILLDPQGHIFLTDLAPSARDATTADDLFALGTLIYQLVRRTARIGTLNPPLDYSPEWTESLDDDAEGWREFTNRLLTKSRHAGPDALKVAAGDLRSLESLAAKAAVAPMPPTGDGPQPAVRRAPPKKGNPLPKLVAIILLLAGAGGGYAWWKRAKAAEIAIIAKALEDKRIAEMKAAEPPAIKLLRAELKQQLPGEIAADAKLKPLLDRIGRSLDRSGSKNEVTSVLGNWDAPEKMKAQAATWRTPPREWTRLAGELDAAGQIDFEGNTSIIEQLQRAIAARDAANALESEWDEITRTVKALTATNNRLLPDFTPWAAHEIRSTTRLADAPARAHTAAEKLREVLAFHRGMGERVLWDRFEKEAAAVLQAPSSELMQAWPGKWKQEAERLIGPTKEKSDEWKKILDAAKERIRKLPEKDPKMWQKKLDDEVAATSNALETDVAAIDKRLSPDGVFKGLRTQEEVNYENYAKFLNELVGAAASSKDKRAANSALETFFSRTKGLKLPEKYQTGQFVGRMTEALATTDKISVDFSQTAAANDWVLVPDQQTSTYATYRYKGSVNIPFLPLGKTGFAMAAVETPLSLAKLSESGGSKPGSGPQIRTDTMEPASDWVSSGAKTFIGRNGIPSYFTDPRVAGDVGKASVPATWLSFDDASAMAKKLGGLLPTPEQWKFASEQAGPVRRLRSTAWNNQITLFDKWPKGPGNAACAPDAGSFSKAPGVMPSTKDDGPVPGATDDSALWLKSVFSDGKGAWKADDKFYNLVGNAAEWVNNNGKPAIMGGSVVSPKSLLTDAVLTPPPKGVYFDVTFRLVVALGPGSEGAGLIAFRIAVAKIVEEFKKAGPPSTQ